MVLVSSISGWKPSPSPQYGSAKAAQITSNLALTIAACTMRDQP